MTRHLKTKIATRILLLGAALAATPAAAATCDGAWDAHIATQRNAGGDAASAAGNLPNS